MQKILIMKYIMKAKDMRLRNIKNKTETTLKRRFINEVYESNKHYLRERRKDYYAVQFVWMCWMDALYRDGEITEKQYMNEIF